jgi:hypothetical protein
VTSEKRDYDLAEVFSLNDHAAVEEGRRLVRAFLKISEKKDRMLLVELAERLAGIVNC